jgi:peptidoglycan-associated lipoprotein
VVKGPGGSAKASATVNVVSPPSPVVVAPFIEPKSLADRLEREVADAYFDYDKSGIREDARAVLAQDALALRSILDDFPNAVIVMEGHCDERGSAEYNIALGDKRTASASAYLEALGVPSERLQRVSYGKERPQCTESTEACWQKNRRIHFTAGATPTN